MTKTEIEEQWAILKQLHYRNDSSINELIRFVSNLIELMYQHSESGGIEIYLADLRLILEMMSRNQRNTKGVFLSYKCAIIKELRGGYFVDTGFKVLYEKNEPTKWRMMKAINHKLRQQIIKLLEENRQMFVTDIYVKLRVEQSVMSQQLAILRGANIVTAERQGTQIQYSLNYVASKSKIAS